MVLTTMSLQFGVMVARTLSLLTHVQNALSRQLKVERALFLDSDLSPLSAQVDDSAPLLACKKRLIACITDG